MFGIAAVPSILMGLGMTISPESPRWLFQVLLDYGYMSFRSMLAFASVG